MFDSGEIAKWADGRWTSAPRGAITGFCFDSRSVRPGDVFFALKSETADGHNYVLKALDAGAAGAMDIRSPRGSIAYHITNIKSGKCV